MGRPRGRTLDGLELKHLQLLLESRQRVAERSHFYDVRLEDFVLELRDDGASATTIAEAAGVSPAAVQKWTQHARARLAHGGTGNPGPDVPPGTESSR